MAATGAAGTYRRIPMAGIALQQTRFIPRQLASWTRVAAVTFAVLALLALSFVLGRVTTGHSAHSTTTIVRPVVLQPLVPSVGTAPNACHPHLPC
jgi:hypothetical protein